MNFGEAIAYWYLRLNGFFLIPNFVLHRDRETVQHSADCDLLAVRFPNTYERVGGLPIDWDKHHFDKWGLNLECDLIGLIVEVKSGKNRSETQNRIDGAFSQSRLVYGIQRLGFWQSDQAQSYANNLLCNKSIRDQKEQQKVVAKLLIARELPEDSEITPCLKISLDQADKFIFDRMEKYIDQKLESLTFFPSELIQYIIWKRYQELKSKQNHQDREGANRTNTT